MASDIKNQALQLAMAGYASMRATGAVCLPEIIDSAISVIDAALAQPEAPAEPALTTCNRRWQGDKLVQQCTLHEAHRDAVHDWAARAKAAERKLEARATPAEVVVPAELSDETIDAACVAWNRCILYGQGTAAGIQAARAILAKSKEKAS